MKVLLLGTRKLGYEGLKAIIEKGHQVVGICTNDYAIHEGYFSSDFQKIADKFGIPFFKTDKINTDEYFQIFKSLQPDIGVSLYWRRLVNEPILSIPKFGFINAHPADLPKYRGFAATSWSILLGDQSTCMCIHKMVESHQADVGDILKKRYFKIDENSTIKTLWDDLIRPTVDMTLEVLEEFETGRIKPQKQDDVKAVNAYPRLPRDGEIDWSRPAVEIDRLIRAVTAPYPGAFTYYTGPFIETHIDDNKLLQKKMFVWKAHVLKNPPRYVGVPGHVVKLNEDGTVWATTGDGILVLDEIQLDGEKTIKPRELINSVQIRFGLELSKEILVLRKKVDELESEIKDIKRLVRELDK
ncbi:MAG: methionyl-tRNA formyltransferase [Thaumarchaeota archaeon]|nr:methionyl-tRNA formyltransferase [Nitrososphaerota archaeon]